MLSAEEQGITGIVQCSAVQCSAVQCTVASTIGLSLLRDLCVETALVVLGGQHDEATNEGAA